MVWRGGLPESFCWRVGLMFNRRIGNVLKKGAWEERGGEKIKGGVTLKVAINAGMVRRAISGPMARQKKYFILFLLLLLFLPVIIVGDKIIKVISRHTAWKCYTCCEVRSMLISKKPLLNLRCDMTSSDILTFR